MKISNQVSGVPSSAATGDSVPEVKHGDTFQAFVKEKLPNQEAVIQTRGKEMRVQFEGSVPAAGESVVVAVKQNDSSQIRVKVVDSSRPSNSSPAPDSIVGILTENYSADELKVVKMLADKGITVTKEREEALRSFLRTAQGELPQKLATIQAVIQKGLPLTKDHLSAVHEALNGPPVSSLLSELGGPLAELTQIKLLLADKGVKMMKEQETAVREFLKVASGEASQKTTTVQLALQRGAPVTADSLLAIYKTINGTLANPVQVQVPSSSSTLFPVSTNTSIVSSAQSASIHANNAGPALQDLVQTILQRWGQSVGESVSGLVEEVAAKLESSPDLIATQSDSATGNTTAQQQEKTDKTDKAFQTMRQHLEKNSNLSEAIYRMKELVPSLDPEQASQWEDTIQSLRRLQLTGSADKGQELLQQFLQEGSGQAAVSPRVDTSSNADDRLDTVYSTAAAAGQSGLAARSILVTEVTKRLSQATQDFRTLKRDITRNLNQIAELARSTARNVFPQVQVALDASIDKLDKAILKSDMTTLTDMGTEKQLLVASSRLADARKQLQQGNNAGARAILEEVSSKLEQMNWRPAHVKVENMLYRQQISRESMSTSQRLAVEWDGLANSSGREHTARSVLDTIRAMGFSHDSDAARYLASSGDNGGSPGGSGGQQEHQQNVKALLLKLAQEDGVSGRTAEQALNSLTGQQLLSKQDTGASIQSLMLSLPLMLSGQTENVKVIVNSRQEGEKVDWENCSLYFALQTRKMGDLGILATVVDRRLSLTLKNDTPQFQERMEPLAAMCRDKLQEIGYQVGHIRFAPLSQEEETTAAVSASQPARPATASAPSLKGFDFKV